MSGPASGSIDGKGSTAGGETDASRRSYLATSSDALAERRATLSAAANELRLGVGAYSLGLSGDGGVESRSFDDEAKAETAGDEIVGDDVVGEWSAPTGPS